MKPQVGDDGGGHCRDAMAPRWRGVAQNGHKLGCGFGRVRCQRVILRDIGHIADEHAGHSSVFGQFPAQVAGGVQPDSCQPLFGPAGQCLGQDAVSAGACVSYDQGVGFQRGRGNRDGLLRTVGPVSDGYAGAGLERTSRVLVNRCSHWRGSPAWLDIAIVRKPLGNARLAGRERASGVGCGRCRVAAARSGFAFRSRSGKPAKTRRRSRRRSRSPLR